MLVLERLPDTTESDDNNEDDDDHDCDNDNDNGSNDTKRSGIPTYRRVGLANWEVLLDKDFRLPNPQRIRIE
jgi:hypothetical protein